MVMQEVDRSLKIDRQPETTAKRRGILNLSATSYKIRIREELLIRSANNQIILVKLVLQKMTKVMENSLSFLIVIPNLSGLDP